MTPRAESYAGMPPILTMLPHFLMMTPNTVRLLDVLELLFCSWQNVPFTCLLCYPTEMAHFVSNGDGLVVTVDSETGDVQWVQNYNSPVVAIYIWQREGLRKVAHTNVAVETLRYLTFMSGEVGRITQWKYPFPKEKKPKNKFM